MNALVNAALNVSTVPTHRLRVVATGEILATGTAAECFAAQSSHAAPTTLLMERIPTPSLDVANEADDNAVGVPSVVITSAEYVAIAYPAPAPVGPVSVADAKAAGAFTAGQWGGENNGGHKVDIAAAKRIAGDVAALKAGGIVPDEAYFAPGTEMLKIGVDKYWTLRQDVENCAPVPDCAAALVARVAREERRDRVITAEQLGAATFDEGGYLRLAGERDGEGVRLNRKGLCDLLGRNAKVFPGAKAWALTMGAEALAMAITDGLRRGARDGNLTNSMFRTRNHETLSERTTWAVVGANYPGRQTDADNVIPKLTRALGMDNARGEWTLDPMTSAVEFTGTWINPLVAPRVGDVWQGYLKITTRDDGQGRIWIMAGGRRILCINCTEAPFEGDAAGQIHKGSPEEVLRRAIEEGRGRLAQIRPMLERWGVLGEIAGEIQVGKNMLTGIDALAAMVKAPDMLGATLKAEGIAADAFTDALTVAFKKEPGESALALCAAITRAAHEARFLDAAQRWGLERRAGEIVYMFSDGSSGTLEA